jgi:hypothetical protein
VSAESLLKFPNFPVKIGLFWGVGGVPKIIFLLESSYFCYLGAHAKIWNPITTPSGVLATAATTTRTRKKKNMQNSGLRLSDTVCTAPLGPIHWQDQFSDARISLCQQ